MRLFKKMLGFNNRNAAKAPREANEKTCAPSYGVTLSTEERFVVNFKSNGGKFLYCETLTEVIESLQCIIEENNWQETDSLILDHRLKEKFSAVSLKSTPTVANASLFLTTCEHLIANDGSIVICSKQIFEKKIAELPSNFIVFATTSQLVDSVGDSLTAIKQSCREKIPTNITSIKHFRLNGDDDFLKYGSSTKNTYLLLLEDL